MDTVSLPAYFKIVRDWPEGLGGVLVRKSHDKAPSHLEVYKRPCGADYVGNFQIVPGSQGPLADLLPNNFGWKIVSPRCRRVLEEIDANVKAFATPVAPIVSADCPKAILDYSLVSSVIVLDCLDLTNPDVTWYDSSQSLVRSHQTIRFLAEKIPSNVSFFGILRDPSIHIVSEALHDALVEANLTGMAFEECELV